MAIRTDIAEYFRMQADWRRAKASEYCDDERNAQCARALDSLADYVESGDADIAALISHSFGYALGGEQVQQETSRYGFGHEVSSHLQHDEFLRDIWCAAMADAYELTQEHGQDPTEALWPCEIHAAKTLTSLRLPESYWRRRSGLTEQEAEDLLASYSSRASAARATVVAGDENRHS